MNIHFIAIGGSAMHNLAIALKQKGYNITGSDDEIFSPAKEKLEQYNLLPKTIGWNPDLITQKLDCVILGMHAKKDNPELLKAQKENVKIYSYPEFLYEQSKTKTRIVIGGSHGKTTTTAMILHAMKNNNLSPDFMVGAPIEGFDVMVRFSNSNYMVLEGDEYLTSPIDLRPKFHLYKPNIAVITGISWDHVNVFPTFEKYKEQFAIFTQKITNDGTLIYCKEDPNVVDIVKNLRPDIKAIPYTHLDYTIKENKTFALYNNKEYPLEIFGKHNLSNLNAAMLVCQCLGIEKEKFLLSMRNFKGAKNRLETIASNSHLTIFKDFAHSPSKLMATVSALKEQYPQRQLVVAFELHTFSSLSQGFLTQYQHSLDKADKAFVYFSHKAISLKRLPELDKDKVKQAFDNKELMVFDNENQLLSTIENINLHNSCLIWCSSGNFNGLDLKTISQNLVNKNQ